MAQGRRWQAEKTVHMPLMKGSGKFRQQKKQHFQTQGRQFLVFGHNFMKSGIGIRHESPDAVVPLVVRVPHDGGTQGKTLAQLFHIVGDNGIITGICLGDMSGGIDACPPHETA